MTRRRQLDETTVRQSVKPRVQRTRDSRTEWVGK